MRVLVYKVAEGLLTLLIVPGRRKGLPPVLLSGLTRENLREKVGPELARIHGKKTLETLPF